MPPTSNLDAFAPVRRRDALRLLGNGACWAIVLAQDPGRRSASAQGHAFAAATSRDFSAAFSSDFA
jgi:hypothetical protein